MKKEIIVIILAIMLLVTSVSGLEQLHITFDPPLNPGSGAPLTEWLEQGMYFTGPHAFQQCDSGKDRRPDNGTAYLTFAKGPRQTIEFSFLDLTPFALNSVDIAEYSTNFVAPKTVEFVCHKINDTVITADFTTDGLIDGPGGTLDFETFVFGPEFTEINHVEVPTTTYSMDNIIFTKLPGYETLIGFQIVGPNNVVETTAAHYNAIAFFESGYTLNVTSAKTCTWDIDTYMYASIDDTGLLTTEDIDLPEDITIYAQYSTGGVTLEAELSVQISLHIPRILHVPEDFNTIQSAIDQSIVGDVIIVQPGTYYENIKFGGKNITLRSVDPTNPGIVNNTIIDGNSNDRVVTFSGEESADCLLSGFTIIGGYISKSAYGGGIRGYGTLATIKHNIISGNLVKPNWFPSSASGGGLADCDGTIQYNIIADNQVHPTHMSGGGGGLYNCDGKICNNLIVNNNALRGGGLFYCNGIIQNNIIYGNTAYFKGSAISNCNGTIENCIIWQNWAFIGGQLYDDSVTPSYSCIQNWLGGGLGNIDTDPLFVKPGYWVDANDPNIIVEPNNPNAVWIDGDYHLQPDSPCINAGDPNYIPEPNETDLDGNPRINGGRIDMGAYETIHHEAHLSVSPQVINRKSHQPRIMAWMRLPQGITKDQVDRDEPLILYPGGIKSTRQFVIQSRGRFTRRAYVFAFFDKDELMDAIPENGWVELQAIGYLLEPGQYYYGTDTVRITAPRPRRRWPYSYRRK